MNFFAIVIAIQAQAGGNLSEALGNLSRVLRERRKMRDKVGALSMEAKASAVIIGALPFAFVMVAMCLSLAKALYRDQHRDRLARRAGGQGIRPQPGA